MSEKAGPRTSPGSEKQDLELHWMLEKAEPRTSPGSEKAGHRTSLEGKVPTNRLEEEEARTFRGEERPRLAFSGERRAFRK
jgi:hypothetical protein